jgi:glyoxylase-like metal-dependent hydrolase (beta-lactamase superfamily II)
MNHALPGQTAAPGVHCLGDDVVNFYLVERPDGLLLIDAGLPGHLGQLTECLSGIRRTLKDIRAVLLTHAHPDHTGLLAPVHHAGAEVWVHAADAPILRDGPRSAMRHAKPERSLLPYLLRRPAALATPLHMARRGGFTAPPLRRFRTFDGDRVFDALPGEPQVLAMPGHTRGSVAYVFPDRGLVFTGDALVTHDGITGHSGPGIVCRGFTVDSAAALSSLERLDELSGGLILPGHGQPFPRDVQEAIAEARRHGIS